MAESEIGILTKQCLDRRIADRVTLEQEIAAWEERRNRKKAKVKWLFSLETRVTAY